MEGSYHHHVYGGGIPEQANHAAPPWAPPAAGFPALPPGTAAFGASRFPLQYGFDPSVPPPSFDCPPPGHYPGVPPFQPAGPDCSLRQRGDPRDGGGYGGPTCPPQPRPLERDGRWEAAGQPEDEEALQRRQDRQWLARFLQSRGSSSPRPPRQEPGSVPAFREALYGAARQLRRLQELCRSLQRTLEADSGWSEDYLTALEVKRDLQQTLERLTDGGSLELLKGKVARIAARRSRRLAARKEQQLEERVEAELRSQKEASVDQWRRRRIQQVEEKQKEAELKRSADSVLCEVRRKQADVKRMQDVMRSLEKLRKLRKEAAARKGVATEPRCDEAFGGQLEQLRDVTRRRTELYSAEEKALMVMLEGEQQEERRREQERRARKERERQLERRRRADAALFGEEAPSGGVLQPFQEFYSQAERSLQALIHIRADWDAFLVATDHPDGSLVPPSWVLPDPPADPGWASALQAEDGC